MKKFIFWTSVFIIGVRAWILLFFGLFGDTEFAAYFMEDGLHHYHIGFVLILIAIFLRKYLGNKAMYVIAFGLALIIDEYRIMFHDVGIYLPYQYASAIDSFSIILISSAFFVYMAGVRALKLCVKYI
jgi:hypothetical protein